MTSYFESDFRLGDMVRLTDTAREAGGWHPGIRDGVAEVAGPYRLDWGYGGRGACVDPRALELVPAEPGADAWLTTPPINGEAEESEPRVSDDAIIGRAEALTTDRGRDYGHPRDNFQTIADFWEVYLDRAHPESDHLITPEDVGVMMVLLKIAREAANHKADNLDDIEGYAHCVRMILE